MLYLAREDGQGLVEYALLIALVAIVIVVILGVFGQQLGVLFDKIVTCLPEPQDPICFGP
jgi:pilus assembly protein Flp/PilA